MIEWEGDWESIKTWVLRLLPEPVAPTLDQDVGASYPTKIELLAGAKHNLVKTNFAVEVKDLEGDDLVNAVREIVEEHFTGLPDTRLQGTIKLVALRVVNGEPVDWKEKPFEPRTFTRKAAPNIAPGMPSMASPAGGMAATFGGMAAAGQPAVLTRVPQPASGPAAWNAVAQGVSPVAASGRVPGSGGITDAMAQMQASVGDASNPFTMFMFMIQMVFSEHRFLIDNNAILARELVGVLREFTKGQSTEAKDLRKSLENFQQDRLNAFVSEAESKGAAEKARQAAEIKHLTETVAAMAKNTEDQRAAAVASAAQLAQVQAAAVAAAAVAAAKPAAAAPDQGMRGRLEEKAATAAERVVETIIAGMAPQPPAAAPGTPGVQLPAGAVAAAGVGVADLMGMDLSKVTPDVAAMLIKMLPDATRQQALRTVIAMDPTFGAKFGAEVADAIDGVAPPAPPAPSTPPAAPAAPETATPAIPPPPPPPPTS